MTLKVLIVEDARAIQETLVALLDTLPGFEVAAMVEGEMSATEWLQVSGHAWDVGVVDLLLADGSGFNLLRRLRDAHPAGHLVVFSDFVTPVLASKCMALGADAVFKKDQAAQFGAHLESLQKPPAP